MTKEVTVDSFKLPAGPEPYDVMHARLTKAFNRVHHKTNWKLPVRATLPLLTEAERDEISEAVTYFTGSVAQFRDMGTRVRTTRVTAAGYYRTIGS
jgi:hypothetical protein